MKDIFILGINGSPHHEGTTCELLNLLLSGASEAGAETRVVHLYDLNIVHEPGHYSQNPLKAVPSEMPRDGIVELYPEILRADGLVFATPVYWANMSGVMKDFIDHLTPLENDGFQLEGKVAAFIAASKENEGGLEMAVMSMVTALAQMGVLIPPNSVMWYPGGWTTTRKKFDSWAKKDAPKVGRNMVKLVEILKKNKIEWSS